jgi:hypothetical protein
MDIIEPGLIETGVIELGLIVEATKGGLGCLVEAVNCSPWAGDRG